MIENLWLPFQHYTCTHFVIIEGEAGLVVTVDQGQDQG